MCGTSSCGGCKTCSVVLAIIFTLTTIAAAIGLYQAHFVGGIQFGTVEGSLSIFALVASLLAWKKVLMACCGCDTSGCGGCGGCGDGACSKEDMAGCGGCGGDHAH